MGLPMTGQRQGRAVEMVSVLPLGPGSKLAVVEFAGKQHLLAITRNGITRLADSAEGQKPSGPYSERIYSQHGDGDFHVG
jgi:flagellar protein FliO/FliZ